MKYARMIVLIVSVLGLANSTAVAHPGHYGPALREYGLVTGLTHPLLGIDHLLAMMTVGLLSAQIGGRAIWAVPASFLGSMVVGGIAGMSGRDFAAVEFGIAASIMLLGLAVALNLKLALTIPLVFTGIFGFFHGHAHGTEMPLVASPALYAVGFVAATLILHLTGVTVGRLALHSARGSGGLRITGAIIAASGIHFALMV